MVIWTYEYDRWELNHLALSQKQIKTIMVLWLTIIMKINLLFHSFCRHWAHNSIILTGNWRLIFFLLIIYHGFFQVNHTCGPFLLISTRCCCWGKVVQTFHQCRRHQIFRFFSFFFWLRAIWPSMHFHELSWPFMNCHSYSTCGIITASRDILLAFSFYEGCSRA